jgi:hypothetical protein
MLKLDHSIRAPERPLLRRHDGCSVEQELSWQRARLVRFDDEDVVLQQCGVDWPSGLVVSSMTRKIDAGRASRLGRAGRWPFRGKKRNWNVQAPSSDQSV